ncbi:MAG: cytochrome c oxidase subunit 4 [Desulforhopalus sp.]|jgi:cytochrome c oxidase subunit 4
MSANTQHMMSYTKLASVLIVLIIFTGVTVGVSYFDMGVFNVPIALGIACFKVSLVLLFFMHLKYESKAITISFLSTICFLAIMISFTFFDVAFR